MRVFIIAFICLITYNLSSQNSFLELDESLYNSALSKNTKLLAVASKKKVYIVDVASLTILKTVDIINEKKSKNLISAIKFDKDDSSLIIKVFNLDNYTGRYENQEYFIDFNYTYDLKEDLLSKTYPALEYISKSNTKKIKGFNELSDTVVYYNPKNSILTLDEKYQIKINNTILNGEKYDDYYSLLQYVKDSETSTITLNDSINVASKGRIRHLKSSNKDDTFVVVYLDSINANNNYYIIELRDSNSLAIIASKNYVTKNIIDRVTFVEKDTYLAIHEKIIAVNYYDKQSKSSIYHQNYRVRNNLVFLETKTLNVPEILKDSDLEDFAIDKNTYSIIKDGNIVNYDYSSKKVLSVINNLDLDFYKIRGLHRISKNQILIIGSASDDYKSDYKNGILKYSLEENKLNNDIENFESLDTLYNASVPFIQNNTFFGDKIQFNEDKTIFLSQDNSGSAFQIWSAKNRKKLFEIDLQVSSKNYLSQDGKTVLIFSKPDNLANGFLLRKLDLKTGILKGKQFTVDYGKNPMFADFYFNHSGSKWIGVDKDIIWEIDLETMSYKTLLKQDYGSSFGITNTFLKSKKNTIFFKGTFYSDVHKRKIEGVWKFNTDTNQLKKIDVFTESKDVFKFNETKLISYDTDKYTIYDTNSETIIENHNINSQFIYNVITHKNKSYVLLGDGERHSKELAVIEFNNINNRIVAEFKLEINYSFRDEFQNIFATENGLVYPNESNLYIYSPELKYTNKWQSSTGNKYVKYINIGNNGKLIVNGAHSIDLKTLETKKLDDGLDDRSYGDFFLSNGNENEHIMITTSNKYSDKPYIQCKLVKDKISKEIIWESEKLKFDNYTYLNRFNYTRNKDFILFFNKSSRDKNYYVIDLQKKSFTKRKSPIKDYYFSGDRTVLGKTKLYLYDYTKKPITYVYDLASGKLLTTIKDIQITDELPNGKLLYVNQEKNDDAFYLGTLKGENLSEEFKYYALFNGDKHIYDDKREYIIGVYKGLYFYKKNEKSPFKNIKIDATILSLSIQNDLLFVLLQGGVIKIIDLNTFKEKVTINIVEKNDITKSVFFTPEGYFKASKENIRNYHFVKESKAFPLLNYELFLNRPDIILDELGYANKDVINIYKEAFLKRLKRNNLNEDTDYLNLKRPSILLTNRAEIKTITDIDSITLSLKKLSNVEELLVYINGVPVLKNNNREHIDIKTTLKLNEGLNAITIIGKDANGIESDPIILEITNTKKAAAPNIFYVGIGVSNYLDASMNLKFADKDVRSISKVLSDKFKGRITIDTLNNKYAIKENIIAIKEKLKSSKINDIVIISFSGHGLVDAKKDFYFATHDIDFNNPNERGISYNDIQFLLEDIPARKKILLLDACHSGELDEEDNLTEINSNENVNSYLPEGAKGIIARSSNVGLQDSFELMQSLFYDLDRGNGSFVISAAGGKEYAFESKDWGNGVFTYSFIKAIQELGENDDEKINISELKDYIYRSVTRLTGNKQKPTSRSENLEWDWILE
jgi:hypothetical protein